MKPVLGALARLAAVGLAIALGGVADAGGPAADLVLHGADVYTVDAARSWATAIAIGDGQIRWVGDAASAERFIGERTRVLDLTGRFILPGFHDAHIHPVTSGVEVEQCDLSAAATEAEVLEAVRECAARKPEGWLVGAGWQLPIFANAEPSKEALDAVVGARPAYLAAADGHSAWVSSRALELAGIGAETPDPPRGRIERQAATGEPSGTLREAAAGLVGRLVPEPSLDERLAGLRLAQERLLAHGVTAIQEAHATVPVLETYAAAAERGELRLRVTAALATDPARGVEQVAELVALRGRFYGGPVQATAVKIFVDGVIEARTAAMLEPYLDPAGRRPGERGTLEWPPERLDELVAALCREGFDVHFHAIGDAAVRAALDAVEAAGTPDPRRRHQIAHLEVIHPDDLPRFRRLGVIANFQPLWAHADSYIVDLTWPVLGPLRSSWIYPIASVARAGGILAFGSDWSVSSLDPLEGIQVAVTRRAPASAEPGQDGGKPMQPEEIVDLPTAIAAYTIGSAWAGRREAIGGTIEPGKRADLVVLSANPFERPPGEIASARVLLTLIDGEIVYRAPADDWNGEGEVE